MSGPLKLGKGHSYGNLLCLQIQVVCESDETEVFFSQIFFIFYNKEVYKHILSWFRNFEDRIFVFCFSVFQF